MMLYCIYRKRSAYKWTYAIQTYVVPRVTCTSEKEQSCQQMGWGLFGNPQKKMNLGLHFTPFTKIKPKCIIDLNVRANIIKLWKIT